MFEAAKLDENMAKRDQNSGAEQNGDKGNAPDKILNRRNDIQKLLHLHLVNIMNQLTQQKSAVMESDDLRRFFAELLRDHGYIPTSAMQTMGKLIKLTVEFRDRWVLEHGETLTVGETRAAIEIYLKILKTDRYPEKIEPKLDGLIRLWLKEINGKAY